MTIAAVFSSVGAAVFSSVGAAVFSGVGAAVFSGVGAIVDDISVDGAGIAEVIEEDTSGIILVTGKLAWHVELEYVALMTPIATVLVLDTF